MMTVKMAQMSALKMLGEFSSQPWSVLSLYDGRGPVTRGNSVQSDHPARH